MKTLNDKVLDVKNMELIITILRKDEENPRVPARSGRHRLHRKRTDRRHEKYAGKDAAGGEKARVFYQ